MKKNEVVLAEMIEKKSTYGNVYFEGKHEGGGRLVMQQSKDSKGRRIWKLFLSK